MEVYERIKLRRKELDLTADDVAEALGVSRATIYRYESAAIEKLPTSIINPLAKVLHCSPSYLMGWDTDEEILTAHDKSLLSNYRKLNKQGQEYIEDQMSFALSQPKFVESSTKKEA